MSFSVIFGAAAMVTGGYRFAMRGNERVTGRSICAGWVPTPDQVETGRSRVLKLR